MASLDALSPLNVLSRGFSITEDQGGRIVRSSAEVTEGDAVRIRLSTGALHAEVRSKE
jgi:exodeoxyribonuclease VII large subunit